MAALAAWRKGLCERRRRKAKRGEIHSGGKRNPAHADDALIDEGRNGADTVGQGLADHMRQVGKNGWTQRYFGHFRKQASGNRRQEAGVRSQENRNQETGNLETGALL